MLSAPPSYSTKSLRLKLFILTTGVVIGASPIAPAASSDVTIIGSNDTSITASIQPSFYTAFGIQLQDFGQNLAAFNPLLGTVVSSNLTISGSINETTYVNTPPPNFGTINRTNYSVNFPLLGSGYSITGSGGSYCPGTYGCTTGTVYYTPVQGSSTINNPPLDSTFVAGNIKETNIVSQASVSGSFTANISAKETIQYMPFTATQYLQHAISKNSISVPPTVDQVNTLIGDIVALRDSDGYTASQNTNLRNTEYYLRGYAGALALSTLNFDLSSGPSAMNTLYNIGGPVGLGAYNALKTGQSALGIQTSGSGQFPNSPPGGMGANLQGFSDGLSNTPLNNVSIDNIPSLPNPSSKTLSPLNGGKPSIQMFFLTGQNPGQLYSFDPKIEQVVSISSQGSAISYFDIVSPITSQKLELYIQGKVYEYSTGTLFDFKSVFGSPVYNFAVTGFPTQTYGQELAFQLGFADNQDTLVAVFTGSEALLASPNPRPSTGIPSLIALGGAALWLRRDWLRQALGR